MNAVIQCLAALPDFVALCQATSRIASHTAASASTQIDTLLALSHLMRTMQTAAHGSVVLPKRFLLPSSRQKILEVK